MHMASHSVCKDRPDETKSQKRPQTAPSDSFDSSIRSILWLRALPLRLRCAHHRRVIAPPTFFFPPSLSLNPCLTLTDNKTTQTAKRHSDNNPHRFDVGVSCLSLLSFLLPHFRSFCVSPVCLSCCVAICPSHCLSFLVYLTIVPEFVSHLSALPRLKHCHFGGAGSSNK